MEGKYEFVENFADTQLPNLKRLETYAKQNYIPICKKSLANFLYFFVAKEKPKNILEIGTAIGYSGIIMAKAYSLAQIDTIELDVDRLNFAKQNFKHFNVEKQIQTICGDAGDVILNLKPQTYDMIFLDGPKTQYYSYLNSLKALLKSNGTLIADNIFQRGMVVGEKEVENKHKSTILKMNEFIYAISKDGDFISTILPIDDGVLLATKN